MAMAEIQRIRIMEVFGKNGIYFTVECAEGSYTAKRFKQFLKKYAEQTSNSELIRRRRQNEKT